MDSLDNVGRVALPPDLCHQLLDVSNLGAGTRWRSNVLFKVIRKKHYKFQRINKEEEPPLRMLDHGLYGEFTYLSPGQTEPNPYVLRSGDRCYHAFRSAKELTLRHIEIHSRFDQDLCDERAHDSEFLCSIHGEAFYDNQTSFRQILSYSGGVSADSDIPAEV